MTTDVLSTLHACLSHNPQIRCNGEAMMNTCSQQEDFAQQLLSIALSASGLGERQLAAVSLKNYADSNWCFRSERYDQGVVAPDHIKAWVRANILAGLSLENSIIRSAIVKKIYIGPRDIKDCSPGLARRVAWSFRRLACQSRLSKLTRGAWNNESPRRICQG